MNKTNEIHRYMNLNKFELLLKDKALFLTKMSVFSDKLEGGLTATDYLNNSNDLLDFDVAINMCLPQAGETKAEREKRLEEVSAVNRDIRKRKFETPFGCYSSDDIEHLFPLCRDHIYVSCWHKSQHECLAMWKIYGVERDSVCIISTIDKLQGSIQPTSRIDTLLFDSTDYINHKDAVFTEEPMAPFKAKSLPFRFEKEMRVIGYNSHLDLREASTGEEKGINIPIKSLGNLIDKVIVSPTSNPDFIKKVRNLCDEYSLEVKIENSILRRKPIKDVWAALELKQSSGS